MTLVDPQGTMARVMRPADTFETLYQGVSATTPILLVPPNPDGEFKTREHGSDERLDIDLNLVAMKTVGRDSNLRLYLPRLWSWNTLAVPTFSTDYQYLLLWRMRQLQDHLYDDSRGYSLADRFGVPDTTAASNQERLYVPCAPGPLITPVVVGWDDLPLVAVGVNGVLGQGVYDPNNVGDKARQPEYYPPEIVQARGDELGIAVRRVNLLSSTTWDFDGVDAPFSNYFGTGQGNHEIYHHLGVEVYTTTAMT